MRRSRSPWYLVTGLVLGLALGLLYGYVLSPISHSDTYPINLPQTAKDTLRLNIALAYQASGDLGRAQTRLGLLGDPDPIARLNAHAQEIYTSGDPQNYAGVLSGLASDLVNLPIIESTPAEPLPSAQGIIQLTATLTQELPSIDPTSTPLVTPTQLPSRTPTATQGSAFQLVEFELICDPSINEPLLQVFTFDASRRPVPGVELVIFWGSQQNHFFTGLKPEVSLGYADFELDPGVNYTLQLVDGGEPVQGITPSECETEDGERYWGSITLAFQQP